MNTAETVLSGVHVKVHLAAAGRLQESIENTAPCPLDLKMTLHWFHKTLSG